jgi:hypothetical protein
MLRIANNSMEGIKTMEKQEFYAEIYIWAGREAKRKEYSIFADSEYGAQEELWREVILPNEQAGFVVEMRTLRRADRKIQEASKSVTAMAHI